MPELAGSMRRNPGVLGAGTYIHFTQEFDITRRLLWDSGKEYEITLTRMLEGGLAGEA